MAKEEKVSQAKIKAQKILRNIQTIITAVAIELILIHVVWPSVAIDSITLSLLVIAAVPWLFPFISSIEIGDLKIGFRETGEIVKGIIDSGLTGEPKMKAFGVRMPMKRFLPVIPGKDPNLALAYLRVEIEKKLRNIAEGKSIAVEKMDLGQVLVVLSKNDIFSNKEKIALENMIEVLDRAAHGAEVDKRSASQLLTVGENVLRALEAK